ncbi:MAG: hypothetical protein IPM48_07670 [Saprospiraceae bacterium]|nr:hypothetical protein [Saprospiraceae bacterium]
MPSTDYLRMIFQSIMALVYVGLGGMIFFLRMPDYEPWNQILGILFILYGIWRGYRAFENGKENEEENWNE